MLIVSVKVHIIKIVVFWYYYLFFINSFAYFVQLLRFSFLKVIFTLNIKLLSRITDPLSFQIFFDYYIIHVNPPICLLILVYISIWILLNFKFSIIWIIEHWINTIFTTFWWDLIICIYFFIIYWIIAYNFSRAIKWINNKGI